MKVSSVLVGLLLVKESIFQTGRIQLGTQYIGRRSHDAARIKRLYEKRRQYLAR